MLQEGARFTREFGRQQHLRMGDIEDDMISNARNSGFVNCNDAVIWGRQPRDQSSSADAFCSGDCSNLILARAGRSFLAQPLEHAASENVAAGTDSRELFSDATCGIGTSREDNAACPALRKFGQHLQYQQATQAVADEMDTWRRDLGYKF